MNGSKWHVIIPGGLAVLTIGGIILLDAIGKTPPDVLTGLATAFGVWATGGALAASANKVDPAPPTPPTETETKP